MNFDETPEFKREFKKLSKKYKSLLKDLKDFMSAVSTKPLGPRKSLSILAKQDLRSGEGKLHIAKAHFFCGYLKSNHKLRIVYAYFEQEQKIEFIEIYFKGSQSNHNIKRINDYLKDY